MQKILFVGLLLSFVFLFGCILPESNDAPAPHPPDINGVVIVGTNPPANITDSDTPQENPDEVFANETQTNETGVSSEPPENQTKDESGFPEELIGAEDKLSQKIEGTAVLDSNAGRYSTKRCNIELSRSQIETGDEISVKIYAYSPSNERVSFLCGESEKLQGYGGLFQDEILCDFETTGMTTVWISLDGYICATAPLRVVDKDSRFDKLCSVVDYTYSDESTGASRRFEASVYLTNYNADDMISWTCGETEFEVKVGELILAQEKTGYVRLTCDFPIDPGYINSIPVHVGDDYCGDLIR